MRILGYFVLPATVQGGACDTTTIANSRYCDTATNSGVLPQILFPLDALSTAVEAVSGTAACHDGGGSTFLPGFAELTGRNLKAVGSTLEWDENEETQYKTTSITKCPASAGTVATTTADTYWHLHGEYIQGPTGKNVCVCGGTDTHSRDTWDDGTGRWDTGTKSILVDSAASNEAIIMVHNAGEMCICTTAGLVDQSTTITASNADLHGALSDPDSSNYCVNLLFTFAGADANPTSEECPADEYCDIFASPPCRATDEQLFNTATTYVKAASTANWCSRRLHEAAAGSGSDHRTWRALSTDDTDSAACTDDYYCNPYGTHGTSNPRCIDHAKNVGASINVADAVRKQFTTANNSDGLFCISNNTGGAKICAADYYCNPKATSNDNLCVKVIAAHANDFGPDPTTIDAADKPLCISDYVDREDCAALSVCNFGGDNLTTPGAKGQVCLAKLNLVGAPEIVTGDNWNLIKKSSLRVTGTATQVCMARASAGFSVTPGGKSFSEICVITPAADKELCNPNADNQADVCIKASTVLAAHGDAYDKATDVDKKACIGDLYYNLALTEAKPVCNQNAQSLPDVDIAAAETLAGEGNAATDAFDKVGAPGSDPAVNLWCFDQGQAEQCTTEQTCNPRGNYNDAETGWTKGTGDKATCITTLALIGHGEQADFESEPPKIFCIGLTGASTAEVQGEDVETDAKYQCNRASGTLSAVETQLAGGSVASEETDLVANVKCFATAGGVYNTADCPVNNACNPLGSVTDPCGDVAGGGTACTTKNICIPVEEQLSQGDQFDETAAIGICLAADGTKISLCDVDNPFCDPATGECGTTPPAESEDAEGEGHGPASGSSAASLVGLSVAAILSA